MEGKNVTQSKSRKKEDSFWEPLFRNHLNEDLIKNIYKMIKTNKRVLIKELPDINNISFDDEGIKQYIQQKKENVLKNRPLILKRMVEIDNMLNVINRRFGCRLTIKPVIDLTRTLV